MADEHEPVLLCHEHLRKPGEWCHRRMAAEWFEQVLGAVVPETVVEQKPKTDNQLDLLLPIHQ